MRKVLYIFSLIISLLLNASADVYKLKVKDELAQKDEFWVEDGAPTPNKPQALHTKFVAINGSPLSIANDWINSDKIDDQKYKNPKIIYFKKDSGEVVIYLKGIENQGDRRAVAKQQFENILKCGLIKSNSFNERIFKNDFTTGHWEMPGIAAKVSKDKSESYVLCSLKRTKGKQVKTADFIAKEVWKNLPQEIQIKSFEHTERQLMFSMLYGCTQLTNKTKPSLYSEATDFFLQKEPATATLAQPASDDLFFLWTRGNPCISIDGLVDNGGYCCAVWYKEVINALLHEKGAKMYLFYGEKSGAHKDIQVRLCGTASQRVIYPTAENFNPIHDLVDIFFVDSNRYDKNFCRLLDNFETNANSKGIGVVYNSVIFSKTVMEANLLCCLISGQSSFGYTNSSADPIAILNVWMGTGSSIEYQTW